MIEIHLMSHEVYSGEGIKICKELCSDKARNDFVGCSVPAAKSGRWVLGPANRQAALGSELEFLFTNDIPSNLSAPTARKLCACLRHSTAVGQLHFFPDGRRMR